MGIPAKGIRNILVSEGQKSMNLVRYLSQARIVL